MATIPTTSARPTLLVDGDYGRRVTDTGVGIGLGSLGSPGPLGRVRMATALPVNGSGPVALKSAVVFTDPTAYLVDPAGNFVGESNAIWVTRMVAAGRVTDTRRL